MDPRPPSPARAPDLTAAELPLAAGLEGLPRRRAPDGLRVRLLERAASGVPTRLGGGTWLRPLGAAAALLLGLGLALGSSSPAMPGQGARPAQDLPSALGLTVVDDPSVSLFHALESFDRLSQLEAPAPRAGTPDLGGAGR